MSVHKSEITDTTEQTNLTNFQQRDVDQDDDSIAACGAAGCRATEELQLITGSGIRPRVLCPRHADDFRGDKA